MRELEEVHRPCSMIRELLRPIIITYIFNFEPRLHIVKISHPKAHGMLKRCKHNVIITQNLINNGVHAFFFCYKFLMHARISMLLNSIHGGNITSNRVTSVTFWIE